MTDDGGRMADGTTDLSHPIIVHTLEDIRSALHSYSSSAIRPPSSLVLQTAPGAIFYAGSLYLLMMFKNAAAEFPDTKATFILDCGAAGAEAVSAMQMGHTHLRSSAPQPLRAKLEDIAAQLGVVIYTQSSS